MAETDEGKMLSVPTLGQVHVNGVTITAYLFCICALASLFDAREMRGSEASKKTISAGPRPLLISAAPSAEGMGSLSPAKDRAACPKQGGEGASPNPVVIPTDQ